MTGGGGAWKGGGTRRFAPADKEGWHRVRSNQERRYGGHRGVRSVDVAKGARRLPGGGEITSLYFTSFPDSWSAWDMLQLFDKQGRVHEVVIPARRNAQGRRFGFARFLNVREPERLALILDNIFVEGEKIHVNLPRFQREEKQNRQNVRKVWVKKNTINPPAKGSIVKEGDWNCDIVVEPRLSLAMVGEVITPGKSYYIQDELAQQGVFAIKATPMGSNLVLLEGDSDEGNFNDFIEEARDWLYQWFKWIRPWKPTDVDPERVSWLRCYGIPVHAWNSLFFSKLTACVGEFVCADENTEKRRSLDVARLMVRTQSAELINRVINVRINNVPFSIKIAEDWSGPLQWRNKDSSGTLMKEYSSSSEDDFPDQLHSGAGSDHGEDEVGEDELNALLNALRKSSQANPKVVDNCSKVSKHVINDINDGAMMVQGGQSYSIGDSPISSAASFVEETPYPAQNKLGPTPSTKLGLAHQVSKESPAIASLAQDLPSIPNRPTFKEALVKPKKQRKFLLVGEKRKPKSGKLQKATRELTEVSLRSAPENHVAQPSKDNSIHPSSLFSAGTVLCGGSISSGDIAQCNNRFWALQSKSVARKVWENAKSLGVEGKLHDDKYIDLIEAGERRDEAECSKRANNNRTS